jgi:hypothetical protein
VYDECVGEFWTEGGFTLALFQVWIWSSEILLEKLQFYFSFRNKFIILLPSGILADNNIFSKMFYYMQVH